MKRARARRGRECSDSHHVQSCSQLFPEHPGLGKAAASLTPSEGHSRPRLPAWEEQRRGNQVVNGQHRAGELVPTRELESLSSPLSSAPALSSSVTLGMTSPGLDEPDSSHIFMVALPNVESDR